MKRSIWILAVLALLVSPAAIAGESCDGSAKAAGKVAHKCEATAQECVDQMATYFKGRGWVGIEMAMDEESGAMSVTKVVSASPAAAAGFREGDVLVALNGRAARRREQREGRRRQEKMTPGATVTYTVERKGKKKDLAVTLGEIPENVLAAWVGRHMIEGHTDASVALAQN